MSRNQALATRDQNSGLTSAIEINTCVRQLSQGAPPKPPYTLDFSSAMPASVSSHPLTAVEAQSNTYGYVHDFTHAFRTNTNSTRPFVLFRHYQISTASLDWDGKRSIGKAWLKCMQASVLVSLAPLSFWTSILTVATSPLQSLSTETLVGARVLGGGRAGRTTIADAKTTRLGLPPVVRRFRFDYLDKPSCGPSL
jgi:hypothetical protein